LENPDHQLTCPQLLEGLKCESKWKTAEKGGLGARSLVHNTLRGRRACWSSRMGLGRIDKLLTHTGLHTTHTKWLVHSWSTFGARTSHEQHGHTRLTMARTWGKPPPSPLYYTLCLSTGPASKWLFFPGRVPKSRQRGLPGLWSPITLRAGLGSKCGLKKSCSSRRELSNGMWHVVCSQVNRVDFQLLVVGSQIVNLTLGLSFAHNLCFRCPNEPCEPILDIYTSIAFQWYKELFEMRSFDPCNRALKVRESFRDSNSQHGSSLGSVRVHSLTLFALPEACGVLPGLPLGPQPCNPLLWSRAQS
jgi:hypothetical protein